MTGLPFAPSLTSGPPGTDHILTHRLDALRHQLAGREWVAAFSGGAGSSLRLAAALRALVPGRALEVTGDSASLSGREQAAGRPGDSGRHGTRHR